MGSEISTHVIHLPERWAVLEQALAQMESETKAADETEGDSDEDAVPRDRDAEDTRSGSQPVRQAGSGHPLPRGGTR